MFCSLYHFRSFAFQGRSQHLAQLALWLQGKAFYLGNNGEKHKTKKAKKLNASPHKLRPYFPVLPNLYSMEIWQKWLVIKIQRQDRSPMSLKGCCFPCMCVSIRHWKVILCLWWRQEARSASLGDVQLLLHRWVKGPSSPGCVAVSLHHDSGDDDPRVSLVLSCSSLFL